jgi:hypothetical protein
MTVGLWSNGPTQPQSHRTMIPHDLAFTERLRVVTWHIDGKETGDEEVVKTAGARDQCGDSAKPARKIEEACL